MKRLYIIRHAKSSWAEPDLDDFDRPLNKRGKKDGPEMARRLAAAGISPDIIVSSPAQRAKKTAQFMAGETGYELARIQYDGDLYLGSLSYHVQLVAELLSSVDTVFLVGHNETLTDLAEYLSGTKIGNVPTCGIVGLEYANDNGILTAERKGRLLFFWYPKDREKGKN